MQKTIEYAPTTHDAMIGNIQFTVRSLTPVFANDDERKAEKRRIENGLYSIFAKYAEK